MEGSGGLGGKITTTVQSVKLASPTRVTFRAGKNEPSARKPSKEDFCDSQLAVVMVIVTERRFSSI